MDSWSRSFRAAALAVLTCTLAASPVIAASVSVLAPAAGFVRVDGTRVSHSLVRRVASHDVSNRSAGRFLVLVPHTVRRSASTAAPVALVDADAGPDSATVATSAASAPSLDAAFPVMSLDNQINALGS